LLGTVRAPSGNSAASPTPPVRTPKPAKKPAARAAVWNVAPIVTWYGPGFYGHKTACGQRYTRHIVGVASRTLACGTLVQFRWHGITVVAPVIDRGPFASAAYVFDFSARVSCDLFRERGQANGCFTRHDVQWRVVGRQRK
jgi:rare lipoprotein A (peptidoglycan hydrolase)